MKPGSSVSAWSPSSPPDGPATGASSTSRSRRRSDSPAPANQLTHSFHWDYNQATRLGAALQRIDHVPRLLAPRWRCA